MASQPTTFNFSASNFVFGSSTNNKSTEVQNNPFVFGSSTNNKSTEDQNKQSSAIPGAGLSFSNFGSQNAKDSISSLSAKREVGSTTSSYQSNSDSNQTVDDTSKATNSNSSKPLQVDLEIKPVNSDGKQSIDASLASKRNNIEGISFETKVESNMKETPIVTNSLSVAPSKINSAASDHANMDIKNLIQLWYRDLSNDVKEFERQTYRVNAWDRQLRENQKVLETIVDSIHSAMINQDDLHNACETIEAYQSNLEMDLQNLSESIDREVEQIKLQESSEPDLEREKACLAMENLDNALSQMEITLRNFSQSSENFGDVAKDSSTSSITKVVSVLSGHHETLLWLDQRSRILKSELDSLTEYLRRLTAS